MEISSLDDIQKLRAKYLRDILKSISKATGGIRADLVSKVYTLLMSYVLPLSSGETENYLQMSRTYTLEVLLMLHQILITYLQVNV